ncbi:hypothetical protein SAMN04489712_119106 [Thermomonospora echinospora]|uniref:Uncharacterized protein n=1 Tax=Thermomonospora echinospora TaxID=1992 RepID=A0A1H6DML1_9ACTN|nr:hypothetical protein [Thermomonospora echinospora]SEG86540.1 hypothetical protein SAMN04489712_119106 [Thermomonospora echinospora]
MKAIVRNISGADGEYVIQAQSRALELTVHVRSPQEEPVTPARIGELLEAVAETLAAEDRPWTDAEDAALVRSFDAWYDIAAVAAHLGRPMDSVRRRLTRFGRLPAMDPVSGRLLEADG